jgi:hypothetical protein
MVAFQLIKLLGDTSILRAKIIEVKLMLVPDREAFDV